jgi:hypothetical protein
VVVIEDVVPHETPPEPPIEETIEQMTLEAGQDWELVNNLITCESQWNPDADNGYDRGLWQYNRKWRPDVTDAEAFDPIRSTEIALEDIENGLSYRWVCGNCYLFIEAHYYDLPKQSEIVPNTFAYEGAVVMFRYGEVDHLGIVDKFNSETFTVHEANYEPGKISKREVDYNDPAIIGFYNPTAGVTKAETLVINSN